MIKWIKQKIHERNVRITLRKIEEAQKMLDYLIGDKKNKSTALAQPTKTGFTFLAEPVDTNIMTLSNNEEEIFSIDANGNAQWCNEATYDEVAETFLNVINWKIENAAGIHESRMNWEDKIVNAVIAEAENSGGSLTTEQLTKVVKKCIMVDRLKGLDNG